MNRNWYWGFLLGLTVLVAAPAVAQHGEEKDIVKCCG